MDRRTLLAVVLCFGIYFFWQKNYAPKAPASNYSAATNVSKSAEVQKPATDVKTVIKAPAQSIKTVAYQTVQSEVANGSVIFGNGASVFDNWRLSKYTQTAADLKKGSPVEMKDVLVDPSNVRLAFDDPEFGYLTQIRGEISQKSDRVVWLYEDEKVRLERDFQISNNNPYLDGQFIAQFKGKTPKFAFVTISGAKPHGSDPDELDRQLAVSSSGKIERQLFSRKIEQKYLQLPTKWIAALTRYFGLAVVAQGDFLPNGLIRPTNDASGTVSLIYPVNGADIKIPVRIYFGAKELETLRKVDPSLDNAVDFGWFTIIAYPILQLMRLLYAFLHNYGLAIIIMTLLLKLATYPLTYKSMKSMRQMATLQPQIQKLREKYKNDPQKMNQEMLVFMRSNGYNPAAGCLPILIQMPVFIALYNVLRTSVELYQSPFMFWIHDLSLKDPYYITPIFLTITMFLQQKMTPNTATDPMQQRMLQFMPLIFGVMMISLPSGLTLYMLTNAVAGIFQQIILNRKFNVGKVTTIATA